MYVPMRLIRCKSLQIFFRLPGLGLELDFFSLKTEVSRVEKVDLHLFGPGGPGSVGSGSHHDVTNAPLVCNIHIPIYTYIESM